MPDSCRTALEVVVPLRTYDLGDHFEVRRTWQSAKEASFCRRG